jgi:hypothetical protein
MKTFIIIPILLIFGCASGPLQPGTTIPYLSGSSHLTTHHDEMDEIADQAVIETDEFFANICRKDPKVYYCEFLK